MATRAYLHDSSDTEVVVRIAWAMEVIGDRAAAVKYLSLAIDLGYRIEELSNFPNKSDLLAEKEIVRKIEQRAIPDTNIK